jgi:hypothetical protein
MGYSTRVWKSTDVLTRWWGGRCYRVEPALEPLWQSRVGRQAGEGGGGWGCEIYAVFLPYDLLAHPETTANTLILLARPTGIEPVFPP